MAAKLSKQWAALPLFARRQISVIITYGKMPFVMPEENALLFKTNGRSVSTDQSLLRLTLGIEVLILGFFTRDLSSSRVVQTQSQTNP